MRGKKKAAGIFLAAAAGLLMVLGCVSVSAAEKTTKYVVVLDPGHGGAEDGAYAVHNGKAYREEVINWKISQYTMQELKKENNIQVYLTRGENETLPIGKRVAAAGKYEPDLLVSQHINSEDYGYARGASVLISKGYYRSYLHESEKKFGSYVIQELSSLGISTRFREEGGMEYRLSENGSLYPNGLPRDYYTIVAESVEANFPGVIIEHAFITNYGDAVNFLSTEEQLKRIGPGRCPCNCTLRE